MIDWSQLRNLMWEGRWDALVMFYQAVVTNVNAHWWFGPLLLSILVTTTARAWIRILRYVGSAFARGNSSDR